jgi:hypothetical protein
VMCGVCLKGAVCGRNSVRVCEGVVRRRGNDGSGEVYHGDGLSVSEAQACMDERMADG